MSAFTHEISAQMNAIDIMIDHMLYASLELEGLQQCASDTAVSGNHRIRGGGAKRVTRSRLRASRFGKKVWLAPGSRVVVRLSHSLISMS